MSKCILVILFLIVGCNYSVQKQSPVDLPEFTFTTGGEISFATVQQYVIAPVCLACHSVGGSRGSNLGDINLANYQNVFSQREDIRSDILDGSMPKDSPALSGYQKRLILAWLDAGALEFAGQSNTGEAPPPTKPPPEPVVVPNIPDSEIYYDVVAKYVFSTNCIKCHGGIPGSKRPDLTNYASVVLNIDDMNEQLNTDQMPPAPPKGIPLTDAQKKLIFTWLDKGAPEKSAAAQ
ncbi:MAG: hypothetical protein H7328_06655 [Bdellovibrio sp.]|nr:hypothetical protein [Bdellovibrio sp.]